MGHKDRSDHKKDKQSSSKEHHKSRRRRSREKSIEIISEEKSSNFDSHNFIIEDDDEVLTKRLNASIAKAKERKMKLLEKPLTLKSPSKPDDGSVILLFNTDEIPLPSANHASSNLESIQLPGSISQNTSKETIEDLQNSENCVPPFKPQLPPEPPMNETVSEATIPPPPPPPSFISQDLPNGNHIHPFSPPNISYLHQQPYIHSSPYQEPVDYKPEPQELDPTQLNTQIEQHLAQSKLESLHIEKEAFGCTEVPFMFGESPPRPQFKFGLSPERTASMDESFKMETEEAESYGPHLPDGPHLSDVPHPPTFEESSMAKKPMMKMSLKISQISAAFISSGVMVDKPVEDNEDKRENTCNSDKKKSTQKKSRWAEDEEEEDKSKIKGDKKESSWRTKSKSRSRSPKKKSSNDTKHERSKSPRPSKSSRRSKSRDKSRRSRSRSRRSRSRRSRSRRSRSRSRRSRSRKSRSRRSRSRRSRSRRSRSRSKKSKRSRSRRSRSPSRERYGSRRMRMRGWNRQTSNLRKRRSSSPSTSIYSNKDVDNGLNIDKARLRQIALKNAFKMGLTTAPPPNFPNIPSTHASSVTGTGEAGKEGGDLKGNQSIKDLTDFCKKISDVKDEEYDKIVDGGVVVVDEEEMPFIPARTNKDMKSLPARQQTLQEKLVEMATISSIFPVSRGDKPLEACTTEQTSLTDPKPVGRVDGEVDDDGEMKASSFIDKEALKMNNWVAPGQFVSDTSIASKPGLQHEGGPRPDKDMFTKAPKVTGGIGRMMLMKLGWKEGEGLGKNKHGMTDLIPVSIKTDRKGFLSSEEDPDVLRMKALEKVMQQQSMIRQMAFMRQAQMMQQRAMMMHVTGGRGRGGHIRPPLLPGGSPSLRMPAGGLMAGMAAMANRQPLLPMPHVRQPISLDASSINSVSILTNTCQQQKWPTPEFILLEETHPVTKNKLFKFKITLNGQEFQSPNPCMQKKQAKLDAAAVCLQTLGIHH